MGEERHNVIRTIGVVTKTLVSILFMDWRKVPKDSKEKNMGIHSGMLYKHIMHFAKA